MFGKIFVALAIFSLFAGIIGSLVLDVIALITKPGMESLKVLAYDLGKTIFASQETIKEATQEFLKAENGQYKWFLFWRIITGSLLTIGILYILYRIIKFFVPSANTDLGAKILVLLIAILIFYGSTIVFVALTKREFVPPFHGFIELSKNLDKIVNYWLQTSPSYIFNETAK